MFTIDQYVKVQSLEEAYELAQKKTATILGGCGWLKMGRRPIKTAIDLTASVWIRSRKRKPILNSAAW